MDKKNYYIAPKKVKQVLWDDDKKEFKGDIVDLAKYKGDSFPKEKYQDTSLWNFEPPKKKEQPENVIKYMNEEVDDDLPWNEWKGKPYYGEVGDEVRFTYRMNVSDAQKERIRKLRKKLGEREGGLNDYELSQKYLSIKRPLLTPKNEEKSTIKDQIYTAINNLIYEYKDGNNRLETGGKNITSYANWLYKYVPETRVILDRYNDDMSKSEYASMLSDLMKTGYKIITGESSLYSGASEGSIFTNLKHGNNFRYRGKERVKPPVSSTVIDSGTVYDVLEEYFRNKKKHRDVEKNKNIKDFWANEAEKQQKQQINRENQIKNSSKNKK